MGLFKRSSILDALNAYVNRSNDESVANDYRVLFAKVLKEYNWKQASESTLIDKLDVKFSSYSNGNKSIIESLKNAERKLYLNITLQIHEELNKVKVPKNIYEKEVAEMYAKNIYNKLESVIENFFEK